MPQAEAETRMLPLLRSYTDLTTLEILQHPSVLPTDGEITPSANEIVQADPDIKPVIERFSQCWTRLTTRKLYNFSRLTREIWAQY